MSKVCAFCGKGGVKRNNGRHTSHNKKKTFANRGPRGLDAVKHSESVKPNFREVRLVKGSPKVVSCMRCYKSLKDSVLSLTAEK
ncbi:MAG: 50S ribosomal protein L28 [bacterium]